MKWIRYGVIIPAALLGAVSLSVAASFTLVKDGKPACSIILADKPSEGAKIAAQELRTYVKMISGAELEIHAESESIPGARVLVGRGKLTDAIPGLKIPEGLTRAFREEGFVIYCKDDTLVLAGNDAVIPAGKKVDAPGPHGWETVGNSLYFGTRYATYELLNRLGVRWFTPGEYGEVVPKSSTLTVPEMSVTQHPSLVVRYHGAWGTQAMLEARDLWLIRNKMNPRSADWFGLPADSSLYYLLPRDKIKERPEWFALQPDGTRSAGLPCMADELRRNDPKYAGRPRMLDALMDRIDDNAKSGHQVMAFSPDDGMPTCECELCRKMSIRYSDCTTINAQGNPVAEYLTGNEYFFFVNGLLNATGQKYPGYLIATNGYANRYVPPENIPDFNKYNNLTIMFADIVGCTIHRYDDPKCWQNRRQYSLLKRWCKLTDKVWIYGYNYTMLVSKDTVTPMVKRIRANIPMTRDTGCLGFNDLEFTDISQLGIPTYVVRAALEWNTEADVDAILADYYRKWFGPAAKPLRDFYETLENAFDSAPYHGHEDVILCVIYTPQVMARLADDIARAEAAGGTEKDKTHVRMERLIFDHLRLYIDSLKAKQELRFADAASLMRQMLAVKQQMKKINEFFGWLPGPYNMDWEADRMTRYAKKVNGKEGSMLAPLPETARFSSDRFDVGRSDRWMEPDYDDSKWQLCGTYTGWQNQNLKSDEGLPMMTADGHPYQGYGWYRFAVDVPAVEQGKQAHLFCPAVVDQVWVYVNGTYAGRSEYVSCFSRPHEVDIDITPSLQPGKNVIALRVLCNDEYYGANGIYERPFLYAKK
ncbi:MAG: DUF4838 domain-containing protein [Armatimonadota bacterium]|nr:DUF4838 domain-containing protein [Armatimonadota bacterium]